MYQAILEKPNVIEESPLKLVRAPKPKPQSGQVLIKISFCGVCHTDLHIAEGDIFPPKLPIVPGHQIVGFVEEVNLPDSLIQVGDRVGVAWMSHTCGKCPACVRGDDNLCEKAEFTGFHTNGGFAEYMTAWADYVYPLPAALESGCAAPLLCAGIIGYRSLNLAEVKPGETIGLVGFGASAHLAMQVANHWNCSSYVFTRARNHQQHAELLGATWVGTVDDQVDRLLDRVIIFAPNGNLVPLMLDKLRPGGTLAINAIFMTTIPSFSYERLYGERTIRSITNATHKDGIEFLALAAQIPLVVNVDFYSLDKVNEALIDLKHSRINGEGVLRIAE
jgi:propanol-preferring alcohol dehydrogenase